jgi:hypothetical protein
VRPEKSQQKNLPHYRPNQTKSHSSFSRSDEAAVSAAKSRVLFHPTRRGAGRAGEIAADARAVAVVAAATIAVRLALAENPGLS